MVKPALAVTALARLPALLAARDWAKAERLLRAEARRKAPPREVFYNLAKVLVEVGKPEQAGLWFARAVKVDPDYQAAWFEWGRWSMDRGALEPARDAFDRALALKPDDLDARSNLARIALRLGDWDRAREEALRVLTVAPDRADLLEMAYRAAAETRHPDAPVLRQRLHTVPGGRALWMKAITRVAKGHITLDARPPSART